MSKAISFPKVSVVIPVYNKGPFILEAVESAIAQSLAAHEIIVVDDESADESRDTLAALPHIFPSAPLKIFYKPHSGVADTRNYAIQRVNTEYVVTLDADDLMAPTFIHDAVEAAESTLSDVVYGNADIFGVRSDRWQPKPFCPESMRLQNLVPSFALIRKSAWALAGGYPIGLPFLEDWSFFLTLANRGGRFTKLEHDTFRYRQTNESLCNKYILGNWDQSQALVKVTHPELYRFEEVMAAMSCLIRMPTSWHTMFEAHVRLSPRSHIPYILLALGARAARDEKEVTRLIRYARTFGRDQPCLPAICEAIARSTFDGTIPGMRLAEKDFVGIRSQDLVR